MYMTEESDEEGTIKRRSLPWRSRSMFASLVSSQVH